MTEYEKIRRWHVGSIHIRTYNISALIWHSTDCNEPKGHRMIKRLSYMAEDDLEGRAIPAT